MTPRRGSIYLPVLIVGSIVSAMAVGGLLALRADARTSQLRTDAAEARLLAQAGLESARALILADPAWRTSRSNGTWLSNVRLPGTNGTFSVNVTNPLGALDRSLSDPVTVSATARVRSASQTLTLTFGAVSDSPVTALRPSLAARGNISITNATISGTGQRISTNGLLTASLLGNSVSVPVETGLASTGLVGFTGGTNVLSAPRTYPDTSAFDYYCSNGVSISYSSLPSGNSGRIINRQLLSTATNPFGSTSANGVYVINCNGGALTIQDSRLVATLVVLNASSVTVQGSVNWVPATSGLPALMVQGPLTLSTTSSSLSEASIALNLNPTGTAFPWPSGTTNTSTADSYPSSINGLIYASGNVSLSGSVAVHSVITRGSLSVTGSLTLFSDGRYAATPPPGFTVPVLGILDNSIR